LLVGLQTSDDAAVFQMAGSIAVIQTVDFFAPIVDDPYTFGQIAAANSMSDVYAMGGDVLFALNIAAFPDDLDPAILTRIFEGGADKLAEANAVIAGGHTVSDPEPKYGLVVTGQANPDRIWTKAGTKAGEPLVKNIQVVTGEISTDLKRGEASAAQDDAAVRVMATLNKDASEAARDLPVSACTDITGFGLLGHAAEMAAKSGAQLEIDAASVPLLDGVLALASAGNVAGGLGRNRAYFTSDSAARVTLESGVDGTLADVLFDPQTSGGLLFAIPEEAVEQLRAALIAAGVSVWSIGEVVTGSGVRVR
jgi:selenide,water dikinase